MGSGSHGRKDLCALGVEVAPVAEMQFRDETRSSPILDIRLERERLVISGERLFECRLPEQQITAFEPHLGVIGLDGERPVAGGEGLTSMSEPIKHVGSLEPNVRKMRLDCQ